MIKKYSEKGRPVYLPPTKKTFWDLLDYVLLKEIKLNHL
jgi:hypothetical protein